MALPTKFPECNSVLRGGSPDIVDLDTHLADGVRTACFQLDSSEIEELKRTGSVWVQLLGTQIPPMRVLGHKPLMEANPDTFVTIIT